MQDLALVLSIKYGQEIKHSSKKIAEADHVNMHYSISLYCNFYFYFQEPLL